jgi:hypothetical protein
MVSIEDIALFEKFDAGKLSEKESEDFQQKLKNDAAFKSNYDKYVHVLKSVKQQQRYKERLQLFNDFFKSKDRSVSRHMSSTDAVSGGFPVLAIVVSSLIAVVLTLAVVFFVLPVMQSQNNEESNEIAIVTEAVPEAVAPIIADTAAVEVITAVIETPTQLTINAFMISQSGYFLSQYSKLKEAKSLRVLGADTTSRKVELVHFDVGLDLAVLKAEKTVVKQFGTLVFRLATTQASPDTDIMLSYFADGVKGINGKIVVNESATANANYSTDLPFNEHCIAAPIISKNGNVIGMAVQKGEKFEVIKSTELTAWLNRAAAEGKLPDYLPTTENRLSGLERSEQLSRLTPFISKVLLFY